MTKIEEMQAKLATLIETMQAHINDDKLDEAEKTKGEIQSMQNKINAQLFVDGIDLDSTKDKVPALVQTENNGESANFIRACIKKFSNKALNERENALLLPTTSAPNGTYGEGYILPQDIQTQIRKKVREYKSMRDVLGYIKTTALKGSFPVENLDSLTGLVDFTDGTDGTEATDISFTQISFSLAEKAAFIKLSNTLLTLTDNDLVNYIVEVFAKKAVITENALAIATLKTSKTVKTLADWKALKSSINKDLDPASTYGAKIVTNQDGFDMLDSALDTNGRPILTTDPTNPSIRRFVGIPVEVFSNALIPSSAATASVAGYAPIFYGNLTEGAKFVDMGTTAFATSTEAGFMSNVTVARLIEYVTTVQCDSSDKCYIYGQVQVEAKK